MYLKLLKKNPQSSISCFAGNLLIANKLYDIARTNPSLNLYRTAHAKEVLVYIIVPYKDRD